MNEKINEMLEMQKALDEYITKNNGITKIEKSRLQMERFISKQRISALQEERNSYDTSSAGEGAA